VIGISGRRVRLVTGAIGVAGLTQVLPNGNLLVEGRQEIRVNFEVR
jgi:flagellar basal body L-ring protein FlgH